MYIFYVTERMYSLPGYMFHNYRLLYMCRQCMFRLLEFLCMIDLR